MFRRLMLCALFLAALFPTLFVTSEANGQEAEIKTKPVAFKTTDEVTLQGVLYQSKSGGNSPCVIMLHGFGDDPNKGDLRGLANTLALKGFHVLRFDFRGHGQSTLINAGKFWADQPFGINPAYLPAASRKKLKPKLELSDVKAKSGYYPRLADDIMAARVALDQLNDNGEVNTSSVYLLGVKDSVNLGMLYLSAEWSRPQKFPAVLFGKFPPLVPAKFSAIVQPGDPTSGLDVAGAVWLSPTKNTAAVKERDLQQWVQFAPEMRERTPMLFLYGADEPNGKSNANFYRNEVLAAKVAGAPLPNLPLTRAISIDKTKLSGAELLGKQLATEKLITDYLEALEKERKNLIRVPNRGYATPPAIYFGQFGVCKTQ